MQTVLRLVKIKFHNAQRVEHTGQDGEHKAAHHRGGDAEPLQYPDAAAQKFSQHQHHHRSGKGLIHIQFDFHWFPLILK